MWGGSNSRGTGEPCLGDTGELSRNRVISSVVSFNDSSQCCNMLTARTPHYTSNKRFYSPRTQIFCICFACRSSVFCSFLQRFKSSTAAEVWALHRQNTNQQHYISCIIVLLILHTFQLYATLVVPYM